MRRNNKNSPFNSFTLAFSILYFAGCHREQDEIEQFEVKLFFNEIAPVCLPRKLRIFARELFLRSSCLVPHLIT